MSALTMTLVTVAILVGALVPIQAALNATLAGHGGHPLFAAVVNFVLASVFLVASMVALRVPFPLLRALESTPWFAWLGGLCGAALVFSTIVVAPKLGAASFVSAMIVGTMAVSLVLDHFGVLVFREHPVTWPRLAGGALVVLGMLMVHRF